MVLGGDISDAKHRASVCPRIAYMPQGLGKNLYPDLSVRENIEFFGRLFGQSRDERTWRIAELLDSTGLAPFEDRPAKKLSGGMRQKLGLCCSLIHDPDLLILDEPTTGVDPLSRRQFWELIDRIRSRRAGMSVIVATAYMEEAERFDWLAAMNAGKVLATGSPAELRASTGAATIEDAFIALLPEQQRGGHRALQIPPRRIFDGEPIITARDLTCRFGDFTAVDRVNFTIERGEIFGFLGSNGCGKTTTMKMLTGLLPPTTGEALLFGKPFDADDMGARYRVGYMSQSFSLYTELTVRQNLDLHARIFHICRRRRRRRELPSWSGNSVWRIISTSAPWICRWGSASGCRWRSPSSTNPRSSSSTSRPQASIPLARDRFWEALIDLSRNQGVTIFVSTHFMNEAERCDRIALMDSGRVLATGHAGGTGQGPRRRDARRCFHQLSEEATGAHALHDLQQRAEPAPPCRRSDRARGNVRVFSLRRLLAYTIREALELLRDPIRLGFSLLGTTLLMLVFGFGVSTDVNNLSFAVLDRDQTPESRAYLEELRGSSYFVEKAPLDNDAELDNRLKSGDISAAIEIPPSFGSDIKRGRPVWVSALVDGAMPFRAETIRGYLQGMHQLYLTDPAVKTTGPRRPRPPISKSGSNTIRISTASTPWCRRTCRCCWRCFRQS